MVRTRFLGFFQESVSAGHPRFRTNQRTVNPWDSCDRSRERLTRLLPTAFNGAPGAFLLEKFRADRIAMGD